MVSVFVLIECNHGFLESVFSELTKLGPEMIYKIAGAQYDIIMKVNANDNVDLKKQAAEIKDFKNIRSTLSLIVIT
jgi:hypothetical protein